LSQRVSAGPSSGRLPRFLCNANCDAKVAARMSKDGGELGQSVEGRLSTSLCGFHGARDILRVALPRGPSDPP